MRKFTKRDSWWELKCILNVRAEFTNSRGTFTGVLWNEATLPHAGRQPHEERELMRWHHDTHGLLYVVRSYATPVAWLKGDNTWYVTDNGYSATTKQHLSKLRTAIAELTKLAA